MGGGSFIVFSLICFLETAPGKEISVQRVPARSVDCSKLSQLDISQASCLSSPTLTELRYVLVALACRGTADDVSFRSCDCSEQMY